MFCIILVSAAHRTNSITIRSCVHYTLSVACSGSCFLWCAFFLVCEHLRALPSSLSLAYTRTHTPVRAHTYILSLSHTHTHIHTYTHDHTHQKILDCHWEMWISRTTTMTLCVNKSTKVRERHCMRLRACVNVRKRILAHAQSMHTRTQAHTHKHNIQSRTQWFHSSLPPFLLSSVSPSLSPSLPPSQSQRSADPVDTALRATDLGLDQA